MTTENFHRKLLGIYQQAKVRPLTLGLNVDTDQFQFMCDGEVFFEISQDQFDALTANEIVELINLRSKQNDQ